MQTMKQEEKYEEISIEELMQLEDIEREHLKAKERYANKVKEIEKDYRNGTLTFIESVREVIKVNKAYNRAIRNLVKTLDKMEKNNGL